MVKTAKQKPKNDLLKRLVEENYLFKGLDETWLAGYLSVDRLKVEKLFSNRPVYTAFLPDRYLDVLYVILNEGLIITRSTPPRSHHCHQLSRKLLWHEKLTF